MNTIEKIEKEAQEFIDRLVSDSSISIKDLSNLDGLVILEADLESIDILGDAFGVFIKKLNYQFHSHFMGVMVDKNKVKLRVVPLKIRIDDEREESKIAE